MRTLGWRTYRSRPPEPYDPGERVRVYLSKDGSDAEHHDRIVVVRERFQDDFGDETGQAMDS